MIPETRSRRSQRRQWLREGDSADPTAMAARCPMNSSAVAERVAGRFAAAAALAERWRALGGRAERAGRSVAAASSRDRVGLTSVSSSAGSGQAAKGAKRRKRKAAAACSAGSSNGWRASRRRGGCAQGGARVGWTQMRGARLSGGGREGLRRWWRVGGENGFGGEMGLER
ncbi:hypothetical protein Syun_027734 [Stephania yunnanensis]|uniref:Uncharacterized protein n=1 Tax=Stephania yunnanensis TaxID=152371 RepID=A0AAP0ELM0_9MAGN